MRVQHSKSGDLQVVLHGRFDELITLKQEVALTLGLDSSGQDSFYFLCNGKILTDNQLRLLPSSHEEPTVVTIVPRVLGGKGGFGSMLRAIGAQIEKTTNRDACRDLSGRRLRDINEEQRLKKWFSKQAEREHEKLEAKKRKLDKLRQVAEGPPLPKIDDQQYLQQREDMVDAVFDAVDKGFEHSKDAGKIESPDVGSDSSNSSSLSPTQVDTEDSNSQPATSQAPAAAGSSSAVSVAGTSKATKVVNVKRTMKKTILDEGLDSCTSSDEESDEAVDAKKAKLQ
ncbi:Protein SDE2 [Orchesella cincta]|uniref:Protein SDE2 n=1 Tax=Orchesella cincta TaxID=48709 RepID=A0A1D2NLS6_ORCCI|nr:Protein SDE2 [Orchesella cincta]